MSIEKKIAGCFLASLIILVVSAIGFGQGQDTWVADPSAIGMVIGVAGLYGSVVCGGLILANRLE